MGAGGGSLGRGALGPKTLRCSTVQFLTQSSRGGGQVFCNETGRHIAREGAPSKIAFLINTARQRHRWALGRSGDDFADKHITFPVDDRAHSAFPVDGDKHRTVGLARQLAGKVRAHRRRDIPGLIAAMDDKTGLCVRDSDAAQLGSGRAAAALVQA